MCEYHVSCYNEQGPFPFVFVTEGQIIHCNVNQIRQLHQWCSQLLNMYDTDYESDDTE